MTKDYPEWIVELIDAAKAYEESVSLDDQGEFYEAMNRIIQKRAGLDGWASIFYAVGEDRVNSGGIYANHAHASAPTMFGLAALVSSWAGNALLNSSDA